MYIYIYNIYIENNKYLSWYFFLSKKSKKIHFWGILFLTNITSCYKFSYYFLLLYGEHFNELKLSFSFILQTKNNYLKYNL